MTNDHYGIVAFRSRQQAIRFAAQLQRAGIRATTVNTPRDVALGCGISVRFDTSQMHKVQSALNQSSPNTLIGVYDARREGARVKISRSGITNPMM